MPTTVTPQNPMPMPSLGARFVQYVWYKRSGVLGAMIWMFEVSALIALLLAWIPIVGPFLGPVVGGVTGGRRAGTVRRALLAAVLPAILMSLLIAALGAAAAHSVHTPWLGALFAAFAGAVGIVIIIHNLLLFAAALAGGWMRQRQDKRPPRPQYGEEAP